MDTHHDTPLDPDELASDAFAAGLVLVSADEPQRWQSLSVKALYGPPFEHWDEEDD